METHWKTAKNIFLDTGLRLIIGAIFIIAAISKLPMQEEWVEKVIAYKILPVSVATFYSLALPWLELTIGLCLIIGLLIRPFCLLSIALTLSFISANVIGLYTDPSGGCRCFGVFASISYEKALFIDSLIFIGALIIFYQRKRFFDLQSWGTSFISKLKLSKR